MNSIKTEEISVPGYERVVFGVDAARDMQGIIAVHNSNLGPACGGVRMIPYGSRAEALEDVLRLAKGMSYKSALAGISFGGGKSVLIGEPTKKSRAQLEAFGDFIEMMGGKYIGAKDMNIASDDLAIMKTRSRHVLGVEGEPGTSGDPSPVTARGVFRALEATGETLYGTRSLAGKHVALQGIGHVGYGIATQLREAGARLTVCDMDPRVLEKAARELQAAVVSLDAIYDVPCDIFSPNARGAILNFSTISRLRCKAVVGGANNQLATPEDGVALEKRGILYAPDFAVNAGGIINIFVEFEGYNLSRALKMADNIYVTMSEIFRRYRSSGQLPFQIADALAEERIYGKK